MIALTETPRSIVYFMEADTTPTKEGHTLICFSWEVSFPIRTDPNYQAERRAEARAELRAFAKAEGVTILSDFREHRMEVGSSPNERK